MPEISKEMINSAANGDVNCFEVIYKEFFNMVTNVAYRIVNNQQDAQDVSQEAFLQIYHNLKNFRYESSLKTWIYRITVNTALNFVKKVSRHQHVAMEDDQIQNINAPEMLNVDQPMLEATVTKLLLALNPDQRACIVLRSIEGLSYEQISDVLGVPINTVRTRIKRGREILLAMKKGVGHEM